MLSLAPRPRVSPSFLRCGAYDLRRSWLGATVALLSLTGGMAAAEQPAGDFGKAIVLAPFVVNGRPLSVAIHARTKGDRRYGEKFADEVVDVAYETLGDTSFKGLVIVGAKGEPHPVDLCRQFLALAKAGQLDPSLADVTAELEKGLGKLQDKFKIDDEETRKMGITFDTFLPAMPVPLAGAAGRLYQLAWAEKFDHARIEQRLKTLTRDELSRDELTRYDWVFYVPPHSTTARVMNDLVDKAMKGEKMGPIKRGLVHTALFAFRPFINKAVEGMRKGMLFSAILRAQSKWSDEDIEALAKAYAQELMPDLKPGSGDERKRALAAIEKQKLANAEYAKDPFVKPERLATFDPADYAALEGEYTKEPQQAGFRFKHEGDSFQWIDRHDHARVFYPAGDRLLVNEDGTMTIRFLVDDQGAVTGVEERWRRQRSIIPRKA